MNNILLLITELCKEFDVTFIVEKEGKSIKLNIPNGYWLILGRNGIWSMEKVDKLEEKELS